MAGTDRLPAVGLQTVPGAMESRAQFVLGYHALGEGGELFFRQRGR